MKSIAEKIQETENPARPLPDFDLKREIRQGAVSRLPENRDRLRIRQEPVSEVPDHEGFRDIRQGRPSTYASGTKVFTRLRYFAI